MCTMNLQRAANSTVNCFNSEDFKKYDFGKFCLREQTFIKNPSAKIEKYSTPHLEIFSCQFTLHLAVSKGTQYRRKRKLKKSSHRMYYIKSFHFSYKMYNSYIHEQYIRCNKKHFDFHTLC